MPLPLPSEDVAHEHGPGVAGEGVVQLRKPTDAERRYAPPSRWPACDMGLMRKIGAAKRRMAQLLIGEKIELLGQVTNMGGLRARICRRRCTATTSPDEVRRMIHPLR